MLSTDIKPNQMNTLSITPPASPLFRKDWEMEKSLVR
jgi:hypothetical protein